jgi:hypothetical protein
LREGFDAGCKGWLEKSGGGVNLLGGEGVIVVNRLLLVYIYSLKNFIITNP